MHNLAPGGSAVIGRTGQKPTHFGPFLCARTHLKRLQEALSHVQGMSLFDKVELPTQRFQVFRFQATGVLAVACSLMLLPFCLAGAAIRRPHSWSVGALWGLCGWERIARRRIIGVVENTTSKGGGRSDEPDQPD